MPFWTDIIKRELDDKPIASHLYVTDQCNLDCHYCTEYDNSVPHPSLDDLKMWIEKIKNLGCIRIGLQGGEPLLHPDIVEVVRFCKKMDLKTSMSTNGFKLTRSLIAGLQEAGLDSLQLSVDRMTPIPSTRKSVKTIIPKIKMLKESNLRFNITGVLFKESLTEAQEVLDYGLSNDIPTHVRLIHSGPNGEYAVDRGERDALRKMIDFQIAEKKRGGRIHSTAHLLQYQKSLLNGGGQDWTCVAGYKYFFVSAKGEFWLCSMNHGPSPHIMDVTPELLRSYFHKKDCQDGCGVYCVVTESIANNSPLKYAAVEAWDLVQQKAGKAKRNLLGEPRALTEDPPQD